MKIELNGTTVELTDTNGIVKVDVATKNANVVVNNSLLWTTFDKEEYSLIPEYLRSFIKTYVEEIGYEGSSKKSVFADCYHPKFSTVASAYCTKQNEPVHIRLDYIDDMNYLKTDFLNDLEPIEAEKMYKKFVSLDKQLKTAIEKHDFKWVYSHSQGVLMYGWWDIVVEESSWSEEGLVECWKIVDKTNKLLRELA